MKISDLKKSLAECHFVSTDPKFKLLADISDPRYYLNRIVECVGNIKEGTDVDDNAKLGIQLFNMFRVLIKERMFPQ